jgi:hypothetical protein
MTERDDDLDIVLRPWMHQHAPDAPSDLVLRIYGEIETMSQQSQTQRWLSRFATWPVGAWATTIAVVAILAIAGGLFLANLGRLSLIGAQPTQTPVTSPSPADPTAVADAVVAAWNSGDGQQAAGLYESSLPASLPIGRFMIDTGATTEQFSLGSLADTVTAWHDNGAVLTRTGDVLTQGPYAAYPVTWTSADGSFNGVEVLRLSSDGLVTEQYLIGASTATASASAAGTDVVNSIGDGVTAIAARLGAGDVSLFSPTATVYQFQDGAGGPGTSGSDNIARALQGAINSTPAQVGRVVTQGPFAVYAASNPVTTGAVAPSPTGAVEEGFTVLELNADGLIQDSWSIRSESTNTQGPTASGG